MVKHRDRFGRFVVNRSTGTQDEETGEWNPNQIVAVYDDKAGWQDGVTQSRASRIESQLGVSVTTVDYTLFLNDEGKINDFLVGDNGEFIFPSGESIRVEVVGVQKLGSVIYVKQNS